MNANKKSYKLLSVLSLVLALVMFASACSSNSSNGSTSNGSTGGNKDNETETAAKVNVRLMRGENSAQVLKLDTPVIREIAKQTGVSIDLEPVPGSNYADKKQTLLATNNIPDVMGVESSNVFEFAHTGMFVAISDYLDQMPNLSKIIEENQEIKNLYVDGKLYSLPITEAFKIQGGKALMIRTDIIEELGMNTPATFDELYDTLKAMKNAYPDSYPFTTRGMSFMDAFSVGMGSGYGMTYDDTDNSYFYGTNKAEFKEVLTYLNRLYDDGLLDPDFAINTKENWDERLSSGRSFFFYDNNSFAVNYNKVLAETDENAKFDRIPYLTNSKGEKKGWLYPKGWLVDNYVISSKTKNIDAVIQMFDWMYGPEGTIVTNYGVLGESYEMVDGKPQMLPSIIEKYSTASDPTRVMLSELGAGLLGLAVNVDEGPIKQGSDPDLVRWGEELTNDPGAYYQQSLRPAFTEEENNRLKEITTKTSVLEQDVVKFIIGSKPLSDFEKWADDLTKAGVNDMEDIYNAALARNN